MSEAGGENLAPKVGMAAGALASLLILRRLRKRRKAKKLAKARQKARTKAKARAIDLRVKEEKARGKIAKKAGRKEGKKGTKDRSILEQLVRFTVLALAKKAISQQIELAGKDLGSSKLGKKVVEVSGA